MNPAGAEGTALWMGQNLYVQRRHPVFGMNPTQKRGRGSGENCIWICCSSAHAMVITTELYKEGLGRCSQHPFSCSQFILQPD